MSINYRDIGQFDLTKILKMQTKDELSTLYKVSTKMSWAIKALFPLIKE